MLSFLFVNFTSFDISSRLNCFPALIGNSVRDARKGGSKILAGLAWRRSKTPVKQMEQIKDEKVRCNIVDVSFEDCAFGKHWGVAKNGRWQIFWNKEAYCWDSTTSLPSMDEIMSADNIKASKVAWENTIYVLGVQKQNAVRPSVCSLICELSVPISHDDALEGFPEMIEKMGDIPWPDDIKVYGNFGGDSFADGGMNIVHGSGTIDEHRDAWRQRFLRPKPFLCARLEVAENLATQLRGRFRKLNSRTVSGQMLGCVFLSESIIAELGKSDASRDRFLHLEVA